MKDICRSNDKTKGILLEERERRKRASLAPPGGYDEKGKEASAPPDYFDLRNQLENMYPRENVVYALEQGSTEQTLRCYPNTKATNPSPMHL